MESATLNLPRPSRNGNFRAYLAGGGATAALVAGAVVVFLGVAAFVGFNGLPFGADESSGATVNLAAGVPEAAANAAAPTAGAVADDPATPSAAAIEEILASLPSGATGPIPGISPDTPGFGGSGPDGTIPPGTAPPGAGAVGNTVGGLENTASDAGLNLPLNDLTKGVTAPVDKAVNDSLNGVGGLLGDKQLGGKVTGAVNNATNGLLGPGGLTDSLGLGKK